MLHAEFICTFSPILESRYLNLQVTVLRAQQTEAAIFNALSGFCFTSFWTLWR